MLRQLLSGLYRYVIALYTRRDLETWLLSNLQGILDSGDKKAIEIANQVDADLIELGEGLINEIVFRERLDSYVRACDTVPSTFYETERYTISHTATTDETLRDQIVVTDLVEDHRLVAEFA